MKLTFLRAFSEIWFLHQTFEYFSPDNVNCFFYLKMLIIAYQGSSVFLIQENQILSHFLTLMRKKLQST